MKKPFVLVSSLRDFLKLGFCILLCAFALSLFFDGSSVAVFANGNGSAKSLYGLLARMV